MRQFLGVGYMQTVKCCLTRMDWILMSEISPNNLDVLDFISNENEIHVIQISDSDSIFINPVPKK